MGKLKETLSYYYKAAPERDEVFGFTSPSVAGLLEIIRNFTTQCEHAESLNFQGVHFTSNTVADDLVSDYKAGMKLQVLDDGI